MDVTIACPCPPKADGTPRHEQDTVTLRDRLDFVQATTIRKSVALATEGDDPQPLEILAQMTLWYCLLGIESWTLVDEKGKPVPVTRTEIRQRILDNPAAYLQATDIADAADGLYMQAVMLPLAARGSASSPATPTEPSTSPPTISPRKPRKPSSRSSTTSSPTAVTEATSPSLDGVSSYSPTSASAA